MLNLPFANRREAGRLLADELALRRIPTPAIALALPRGGVPIGFAVAGKLGIPLDVVVVRKLGVPWQPELAMGAIAGHVRVLDENLIDTLRIGNDEIEEVATREQAEAARREALYREGNPPPDLQGCTVLLIDDGIAMGSTMAAAARYVESLKPDRITIAVPVGSREACARLRREADDFVCLATPEPFVAVGKWYADFAPVSDDEVRSLLAGNRLAQAGAGVHNGGDRKRKR